MLMMMRAVALSRLTQKEIVEYFRNGIAEALHQPELDIIEKITAKLVSIFFVEERNQFKAETCVPPRVKTTNVYGSNFTSTQAGIAGGIHAPASNSGFFGLKLFALVGNVP